jgi:hypothetical protein
MHHRPGRTVSSSPELAHVLCTVSVDHQSPIPTRNTHLLRATSSPTRGLIAVVDSHRSPKRSNLWAQAPISGCKVYRTATAHRTSCLYFRGRRRGNCGLASSLRCLPYARRHRTLVAIERIAYASDLQQLNVTVYDTPWDVIRNQRQTKCPL